MRARLAATAVVGLVVGATLVAGCGGDDRPSTSDAGKQVASWGADLEEPVLGGLGATQPWTVAEDAAKDVRGACPEDEARRRFAATASVKGDGSTDADLESTRLTGALERVGWDAELPGSVTSANSVTASRRGEDATGAKVEVTFAPAEGGWSYQVTLRTACLPSSS